jgi:DNA topoisomerase-1
MLEAVAAALGNTPAISRKSYVHPALIELCRGGDASELCELKLPRATQWLDSHERALIAFLDELRHVRAACPAPGYSVETST